MPERSESESLEGHYIAGWPGGGANDSQRKKGGEFCTVPGIENNFFAFRCAPHERFAARL